MGYSWSIYSAVEGYNCIVLVFFTNYKIFCDLNQKITINFYLKI